MLKIITDAQEFLVFCEVPRAANVFRNKCIRIVARNLVHVTINIALLLVSLFWNLLFAGYIRIENLQTYICLDVHAYISLRS